MKLLILSDLHVEQTKYESRVADVDFDVVVLAGDIHTPGRRAISWAMKSIGTTRPIVFVAGNHEYYNCEFFSEMKAMREEATGSNVHILDRGAIFIGKTRFLGCTLWTDYELPFSYAGQVFNYGNPVIAKSQAKRYLSDHTVISIAQDSTARAWTPDDALRQHNGDRAWLLDQLNTDFNGSTVVVTHHSPSLKSVPPKYFGDSLTPAFCSDLPDEFFGKSSIWIHGHHHSSSDYIHSGTRVICNPRGYRMRDGSIENTEFLPYLIVDLADSVM